MSRRYINRMRGLSLLIATWMRKNAKRLFGFVETARWSVATREKRIRSRKTRLSLSPSRGMWTASPLITLGCEICNGCDAHDTLQRAPLALRAVVEHRAASNGEPLWE